MQHVKRFYNIGVIAVAMTLSSYAYAQAEASETVDAEYLEVEKVKEKYWAQGEESQLGVVQNRTYSKAQKIQIGLLGGRGMNDPFLSNSLAGLNLSYNVNEFWGVSLLGWKNFISPSNALKVLRGGGKEANTVEPRHYFGAEGTGSFLYGKLSLLGASIIYYDMHFTGGAGVTKTENDNAAITGSVGLGQRFYITRNFSLRMDYRLQTYTSTVREKTISSEAGQFRGKLRNYNHVLGLELNVMFGTGGDK